VNYIKSILPFSKEVEKKIFENTYGLTASIIYGQIFVGLIQGIIVSLGLFLFGVPNALLLTLVACIAGIIPIFGPVVVWVPVTIYLIAAGNPFAALGMSIFGLISSVIDNILKPIIVSKRTSIHSSVILIGMVGGFFLFGMLGLILGPLVLAYLLVILEIYRNKKIPGAIIPASE
jgi:predicted PurR-regulated permease PerM